MLYLILTYLNLIGSSLAMAVLLLTIKHYVISHWMSRYMYLLVATMVILALGQLYQLSTHAYVPWQSKVFGVYFWGKSLYFCYAIRFTSLKK